MRRHITPERHNNPSDIRYPSKKEITWYKVVRVELDAGGYVDVSFKYPSRISVAVAQRGNL